MIHRPHRLAPVLTLRALWLIAPLVAAIPEPANADVPTYRGGQTYHVAGSWFQYLGAESDERLWLYPTLDGVPEIFRDDGEAEWRGSLGSRFDRTTGEFTDRFAAVEVLEELLDRKTPRDARVEAARLLSVFVELHADAASGDGEFPPCYLRPYGSRIERLIDPTSREAIRERLRFCRDALARVEHPGTAVPSLARAELEGRDAYYRALVADGYLDIAIIGGNLGDPERGTLHSWQTIEGVRDELDTRGLRRESLRRSEDLPLSTGTIRLLGEPIRVRALAAGGSVHPHRIRRSVAAFVEGLAHADVVIYHGHSNRGSGTYWLSETYAPGSRFRVGFADQRDLHEKCHGLGAKTYQIVALQSCYSYQKYCQPMREHWEEALRGRAASVGFLGVARKGYFGDFVPRVRMLLGLLFEGAGARKIAARLDWIRPYSKTPPVVLRGVLQPRFSFIVPHGVEIVRTKEVDIGDWPWTIGSGSDGRTYVSTENFPQDDPQEIVQVVPFQRGAWALRRDGRVLVFAKGTGGRVIESPFSAQSEKRFVFIGRARWKSGRERVWLITRDGDLLYLTAEARLARAPGPRQLPDGVVAVGNDAERRFVLVAADGASWAYDRRKRRYLPCDGPVEIDAPPSLLGHGVAGEVWTPGQPATTGEQERITTRAP